jgi:hypothetical protein
MKTTTRHEYKYLISYVDYFNVIEKIKQLMIHDKHGTEDSYVVTSLYLDDLVYSGATDKAFGNEVHKKYRIRHYDDPNKKKLELKYKVGEVSTKTSTLINDEVYQAIVRSESNDLFNYFDNELIRLYTLDLLKHHLKPTMYMEYKREAYKDSLDNIRITFDHSLCGERYYDESGTIDYQLMGSDKLILEVKYEHFIPKEIHQILKKITIDHIAYSKYFMGFQSIEF